MKLGDSYLLLEQLGDGTHGWVWRAQRIEDNEIVAVKIPKDCSASDSSLREGHDLLDTPSHPNVFKSTRWDAYLQKESGMALKWSTFQVEA
ncbi:hypothetical protein AB4085_03745 [Vibrio cyclitrophicus]